MKADSYIDIATIIIFELKKLSDSNNYYIHPVEIAPYTIDKVLDLIRNSNDTEILSDVNGHDMDWSLIDPIVVEERKYHVYGCVSIGSLVIKLEK